ncbi:MAG: hypothetical protein V5A30_08780 [Haloarculaceae archaeon]
MEIPSLVRNRLGDEDIETAVSLGDEDVVCFTQSRTLLYRGEGLLSDEGVEVFSHDVETLEVSEGRRKTKFVLEYVDGSDSFTVPGRRTEAVLERLLDGILTTAGVIDPAESVTGVFRFSELSLVVTDARLVKHVGTQVWDADFEEFPYADVTGLSFEEGSVATQVVLAVDGRPERIKAPNDDAPMVRETLQDALFAYHDVASLEELNAAVGEEEDDEQDESGGDDIGFSEGISPLVGEGSDAGLDAEAGAGSDAGADSGADADAGNRSPTGRDTGSGPDAGGAQAGSEERAGAATDPGETPSGGDQRSGSDRDPADGTVTPTPADQAASTGDPDAGSGSGAADAAVDPAEFEELKAQVDRLTQAVKRQNEILEQYQETVDRQRQAVQKQGETVERLIEELRQGR